MGLTFNGMVLNLSGISIISSPDSPTIGTATATGSSTATVDFIAPTYNGGSTITSYTAVSSPDGITGTLSQAGSGTITVSGLSGSTTYTFSVYATNSEGSSVVSSSSNQITTQASYSLTTFVWGTSPWGAFNGDGTTVARSSPVQLAAGQTPAQNPYVYISGGGQAMSPVKMAIKQDGTLWGWGWNATYYQVDGTGTNRLSPVQVAGSWSMVSVGSYTTMAIKSDGSMWGWGINAQGQIGTGVRVTTQYAPVATAGSKSWIMVSVGSDHTMAIDSTYKLFTMGNNAYGQIGDGSGVSRSSPTQIGASSWTCVAAGSTASYGIKADGTLWSWGNNSNGQLGRAASTTYSPVQIGTGSWSYVTTKGDQAYAINTSGVLFGWGVNNTGGGVTGLLGVNSSVGNTRSSPVQVMASGTARSVATFGGGGYIIDSDYKLWSWGAMDYGILADSTTGIGTKLSPTQIGTLSWTMISVGTGIVKQTI